MSPVHFLVRRDDSATMTPTMMALLITLLVLAIVATVLVGGLFVLRNIRKSRKEAELPMYNEKRHSKIANRRRLTITASRSDSVYVYSEKDDLMSECDSPPQSPIPEIRITFPEEVDEAGKRTSGRVVVVRVGEQSIGLEPLQEDLPPYQANDRFQSLDLDRMGGLKEKSPEKDPRWS